MDKIILLIGLPGSGKTTLGNSLKEKTSKCHFLDDMSIITNNAKDYFDKLNIQNISTLIISDIFFCYEKVKEKAVNLLMEIFPNSIIEFIYFENNLKACLLNIDHRSKLGDDRKVREIAKMLASNYQIPLGVETIKIFNPI